MLGVHCGHWTLADFDRKATRNATHTHTGTGESMSKRNEDQESLSKSCRDAEVRAMVWESTKLGLTDDEHFDMFEKHINGECDEADCRFCRANDVVQKAAPINTKQ